MIRRGRCPTCGVTSARVHDRYQCHPIDLPWRACSVQVALTVRRFCCDIRDCQRRTFAERFGTAFLPGVRRTTDAGTLLLNLAEAAGGEAGARLARATGLPVSPGTRLRVTLLRLLRHSVLASAPTPRVIGVDYRTVQRWGAWYRRGGLPALWSHRLGGPGKAPWLTPEQQEAVAQDVATGRFRNAVAIGAWVNQTYGVSYTESGMDSLLKRLRCAPKVPRPLHTNANLADQEAWKKGAPRHPSRCRDTARSGCGLGG